MSASAKPLQRVTPNDVICGDCPHERGYHYRTHYGDDGCAGGQILEGELCPCIGFRYLSKWSGA